MAHAKGVYKVTWRPDLQKPADGASNVLSIRAEARSCDRALEGKVVQEHPAAPVDEKGTAILVDC